MPTQHVTPSIVLQKPHTRTVQDYHKWHLRLGHLHPSRIHQLAIKGLVTGLPNTLKEPPPKITCTGCAVGKQVSAPFHSRPRIASLCSHIHTDICGPFRVESLDKNLYFATFIDEFSRYLHVHIAPRKNLAAAYIKDFISHIHHTTPYRITDITMDNGREYFSKDLQTFYNQNHVTTHPTTPYTPQENSIAERVNRTLLETVRSMLHSSKLPHHLWDYALRAATEHHNHAPHSAHGQTPISLWTNSIPDVSNFLPFGQYGFVYNRQPLTKLQPRATLMQYLGRYDANHCYVYDKSTCTVSRCRVHDFKLYDPHTDPTKTVPTHPHTYQAHHTAQLLPHPTFTSPKTLSEARNAPDSAEWTKSWNAELDNLENRGTITYVPRSSIPPTTKILPYKTVLKTKTDSNGNPISRKTRCNVRGDLQKPHEHYDPDSISSPVADRDAIRVALALAAAHGYEAHHWDLEAAFLHESFNDSQTIYIHQPPRFDGTIKYPGCVGKLTGNMYGARQACHIFSQGLSKHLQLTNFTRLSSDRSTYLLTSTTDTRKFVFFVITVDDFQVISNDSELRDHAKQHIQTKYVLKDLGPVDHILRWKVLRTPESITISQPAYISQILHKFGMDNCKPASTPMASTLLSQTDNDNHWTQRYTTITDLSAVCDTWLIQLGQILHS